MCLRNFVEISNRKLIVVKMEVVVLIRIDAQEICIEYLFLSNAFY